MSGILAEKPSGKSLLIASSVLAIFLYALDIRFFAPVVPDEVGYLSIAQYLTGYAPANLSFIAPYSFGQALLLAPAAWMTGTPGEFYHASLAISVLSTAAVPWLLLRLSAVTGQATTWEGMAAAFLVAVFPAYFYHNFLVWPEATFRVFFLVLLYLAASAWKEGRTVKWLFLPVCAVFLYVLHPRALGIVPLVALYILSGWWRGRNNLVVALISLAIIVVLFMAARAASADIQAALWGHRISAADRVVEFAGKLGSIGGIKSAVALTVGHLWSAGTTSFALPAIGLWCSILAFRRGVCREMIVFLWLASAAVLAASVMQMLDYSRVDHVTYERYVAGVTTPFAFAGLLFCLGSRRRLAPALAIIAVLAPMVIVLYAFRNASLSPPVWPTISGMSWMAGIVPYSATTLKFLLVTGSAVSLATFLVFWTFKDRKFVGLAMLALGVVWLDSGVFVNARDTHFARDAYIKASEAVYAKIPGRPLYWDISAGSNGDLLIDQFAVVGRPMPTTNLAQGDIPVDAGAVVGNSFVKTGYSCIGVLPDKTKLVINGSFDGGRC